MERVCALERESERASERGEREREREKEREIEREEEIDRGKERASERKEALSAKYTYHKACVYCAYNFNKKKITYLCVNPSGFTFLCVQTIRTV